MARIYGGGGSNYVLVVTKSTTQSLGNNALTQITGWDTPSIGGSLFNATTGAWTPNFTGQVNLTATLHYGIPNSVSVQTVLSVFNNGVQLANGPAQMFVSGTLGSDVGVTVSRVIEVTSGQPVTLQIYQNSGGSRSIVATPIVNHWSISRVN